MASLLVAALLVPCAAPALAQDAVGEETPGGPPALAGDVLGLRPRLADAGILITSRYTAEAAWNFRSDKRSAVTEAGEFGFGLHFDLKRIAGVDAEFQATVTYRHGRQLDAKVGLGTFQEVQEIYGRRQTWRLTQFWYEQRFLDDSLAVKLGRTAPSEDFAAFSCLFQNLSFCGSQPGNIVTGYWFNWPVSQWGLRVRAKRGAVQAQIAVYEENPRNLDKHFTIGHFKGATGVLVPLEFEWFRSSAANGPVGSYKIGGWISTAKAADLLLDAYSLPAVLTGRAPLQRQGSRGIWISLEQQVTGRSTNGASVSGLSLFVNALATDPQTSRIDNQIVAGLLIRRPLPRAAGILGLGVARTHVSNRFDRSEILAGRPPHGTEYSFELFYGFAPVRWLDLRPNVQWIVQPGGRRDMPAVGIAALKAVLTL